MVLKRWSGLEGRVRVDSGLTLVYINRGMGVGCLVFELGEGELGLV